MSIRSKRILGAIVIFVMAFGAFGFSAGLIAAFAETPAEDGTVAETPAEDGAVADSGAGAGMTEALPSAPKAKVGVAPAEDEGDDPANEGDTDTGTGDTGDTGDNGNGEGTDDWANPDAGNDTDDGTDPDAGNNTDDTDDPEPPAPTVYTVTFLAGEHGSLTVAGDSGLTGKTYEATDGTPWGEAVTVPTPVPDAGYYFAEWREGGTSVTYGGGWPATVTETHTYKAWFELEEYTVTYNHGTQGRNFSQFIYTGLHYGDSLAARAWAPDAALAYYHTAGYSFAGWDADGDGAADYAAAGLPALPAEITGDADYTAVWTADTIEYRLEYYYQTASGAYPITPDETYTREGRTGDVVTATSADKQPTREGYVFNSATTANKLQITLAGTGQMVLKLYFKLLPQTATDDGIDGGDSGSGSGVTDDDGGSGTSDDNDGNADDDDGNNNDSNGNGTDDENGGGTSVIPGSDPESPDDSSGGGANDGSGGTDDSDQSSGTDVSDDGGVIVADGGATDGDNSGGDSGSGAGVTDDDGGSGTSDDDGGSGASDDDDNANDNDGNGTGTTAYGNDTAAFDYTAGTVQGDTGDNNNDNREDTSSDVALQGDDSDSKSIGDTEPPLSGDNKGMGGIVLILACIVGAAFGIGAVIRKRSSGGAQ